MMTKTLPAPRSLEDLSISVLSDPGCRAFVRELLASRWQFDPHDATELASLVEQWARARGEGHTLVVVAVHHGNFPSLEYMAHALRTAGWRLLGVYLQGEPPRSTFDFTYACDGSLARLAALARELSGSVYLQAHGRWAFLSQVIAAANSELRIVQEVWDWMDAFIEPQHEELFAEEGLFSREEVVLMRLAERHVRTRTAGFVHKHGGSLLDEVVADRTVPEVRIMPCPPRRWARAPHPDRSGPWRMVHAGQIKSSHTSRRIFGDLHYLPLIRSLTAQGLLVTAYGPATPPGKSHDEMLAEYVREAGENRYFELRERVPVSDLVAAMHGNHDFGLLLYHFDPDLAVGKRHLQTALASKLFAYLAAGLPILVSRELEYMAQLVEEHAIGLVLERDQIAGLADLLQRVDYRALCESVTKAQEKFCFEHELPQILALVTPGREPQP